MLNHRYIQIVRVMLVAVAFQGGWVVKSLVTDFIVQNTMFPLVMEC